MQSFDSLLQQSRLPFLFSSQPSSADVQLAAYTAFMHRAPVDAAAAQPLPSASSPPISLPSLLADCPALLLHSSSLFACFFPAFAFAVARPPSAQQLPYEHVCERWRRRRLEGPDSALLADGEEDEVRTASGAVAERLSRLLEPPAPLSCHCQPPLPDRAGDGWQAAGEAALADEERLSIARQRTRLWMLGGALAVATFVLWQRQRAGYLTKALILDDIIVSCCLDSRCAV